MKMSKIFFLYLFICSPFSFSQVYTTYHWHLQQPIYWPETSSWDNNTYQKAYESMISGGAHPENELGQIFGKDDRVAAYQGRIRDAIGTIQQADGGAQISYSGCLVENVESLASAGSLGYNTGWESANQQARNWLTSGGHRKLDIVIFPYHHALGPLIDEQALRKEIQIYKELYPDIWGSGLSVGYFPAELSFSERMIQVLVEEGIEWVFVPNNHLSRACENFPLTLGTGGEMCDPPNPADMLNPSQSNWFSKTIDRGCTPTNAYPFAFQPHKAKYVNPETGTEYKITVVPVAQAMSWSDGYQQYGTGDIDQIAWASNATDPMLIVLAHDGDNAYGGGYSYYMESVRQFCNAAAGAGYLPTVVQQYLQEHPVSESDVVHVEDGSWVNADGDFGSPDFINWNWPLFNQSGEFDIANGWAEDERNWAVITAAQNRVETAEQIAGSVTLSQIQKPDGSASNAELAWHFFLPSLTSGYMYYGTALDMEVKPTIACNNAIEKANIVIGNGSQDQTPPTIWIPQQLPHNPGGTGFGSLWGYQAVEHSRDFWVWTFVSDVSGVTDVTFNYRIDNDGVNPLASNQNEIYTGGSEVGSWVSLPMQSRAFPAGNVYNNPEIDFFEMPTEIADQYYIHVQEPAIVDVGGVLVDYYVQATDTKGFIKRSPILHTFVGTGDGGGTGQSGDFVMDGSLDENALFIGSQNGVNLYAAWNHEQLYVACDAAASEDHFVFISNGSSTLTTAPWAKSGQVAQWQAYLANESTNGWSGWFDGGSQQDQARGTVLEGLLDWDIEFGSMPESVYLAMGAYQTQDAGSLQFQIPSGNGDGNIDISEFYELNIRGDLNFDGKINMIDFADFSLQWMENGCSELNNWCSGADLNRINDVNIEDLVQLAFHWLN